MNRLSAYLIPAALIATSATADQNAMNTALEHWNRLMQEYQAAVQVAKTPNQMEAIRRPDGEEVALLLWHSVNKKTGKRHKLVKPTAEQRMNGAKDTYKEMTTYEFEQPWAAPAVAWFLNHPDDFAKVFNGRTRQVSFFANALLESVEHVHYSSPHIADACAKLAESPSVRIYELLQKIYTRNQSPEAKAASAMAMCILLSNPTIASAESSPAIARSKQIYFLRQAILMAPENAMFGNVSMNQMAAEMTYAVKNLSLGSVPPQMELLDKDGNKVKMPQAGKPTLLFFWTPDESIGLDIVQRQDQLAAQYPDLVFCPINVNQPLADWQASLQELGITNAYMDNEQNAGGQAYRVSQLPMAVLLNEYCNILFIGFPNQQLQAALNNCFAPADATGKPKVTIDGVDATITDEPESVLQPGSRPKESTAPGSNEAPPLRDMPEF